MTLLPILLLSLYYLPTNSEILDSPHLNLNTFSEHDDDFNAIIPPEIDEIGNSNNLESSEDFPYIKSGPDQTEVGFRQPINSVNIDYSKNAIVLKFRKPRHNLNAEEENRRKSLENNFMRFGRDPHDFMRFGKRAYEQMPNDNELRKSQKNERFERSPNYPDKNGQMDIRDARGDNFMRFGRSPGQDFMRFGRNPGQDFMRFGRSPGQDFMRFGRDPGQDFMRLGRAPGQDFMRFGRAPGQDFMRFGRDPADFMRLGRDVGQNFMRFGRSSDQNSMWNSQSGSKTSRGTDQNFMRFGRPDNFMRFGRSDADPPSDKSANFMRFGRSNSNLLTNGKNDNKTQVPVLQKSDVKEAARVLHETESNTNESNPVDKAIQVLFSKHNKENESGISSSDDNSTQEEEY